MSEDVSYSIIFKSLSARRAWIEILLALSYWACVRVALRKESVDRNYAICANYHKRRVALRKESVDRNALSPRNMTGMPSSLSARRAWIEITHAGRFC